MNKIFKNAEKVEIDSNFYLETDGFRGVVLVHHFPATRKNKEGEEVQYIKEEKTYHATVAQALKKYTDLNQIILPTVGEMLEVQKQILGVLKKFYNEFVQ